MLHQRCVSLQFRYGEMVFKKILDCGTSPAVCVEELVYKRCKYTFANMIAMVSNCVVFGFLYPQE